MVVGVIAKGGKRAKGAAAMKRRPGMKADISPFWTPRRHADRRPLLLARARMLTAIRQYFAGESFVEVECNALQISPGNEAHLHGFATDYVDPAGEHHRRYLHTSPEFACKKILAAGETRILSAAQVFRNRERGNLHAPSFTMIEWYRANEPCERVIADTLALVKRAAEAAGSKTFFFREREADPFADAQWLSVADAFRHYADIDLLATLGADGTPETEKLARAAEQAGIKIGADDSWSDLFSRVLTERIEPQLGLQRPLVLYEYPRVEAALARACPHDPRLAERFELYICGVELANGFGELTDPAEQRRRFEAEMAEKNRVYGETYPIDADFLDALGEMPPASGVALGFDRLVMLSTGAPHIDLVQWTPFA
jgi:lysyl-tRNA synthetase class 2